MINLSFKDICISALLMGYAPLVMSQNNFNVNGNRVTTQTSVDLQIWKVVSATPNNTEISFVTTQKGIMSPYGTVVGKVLSAGTGDSAWEIRKQSVGNKRDEIVTYDTAIRSYVFDCKKGAIMLLDETYFSKGREIYGYNHRLGNEGLRKMFGHYPFESISPPASNFLALEYYCS